MFIDIHHFTDKLIPKIAPSVRHILEKIAILFIPLPLFMLFSGTTGIIKTESPEQLATIGSMGSSFVHSFGMHSLIIAGAFGITFIIWFITRKFWGQTDEELEEEFFEPEINNVQEQHQENKKHTHLD